MMMMMTKVILLPFSILLILKAATVLSNTQCHMGSPSCNSKNPANGGTFPECCMTVTNNPTLTSFLSSTGECVNCGTVGCHVDPNCASQTGIEVEDCDACCALENRRSFRDPNDPDGVCKLCGGGMVGDPHFIVPLSSNKSLCYSIQGYPGLAFNLFYSKNIVINAHFVDSVGDTTEATWIGKLAVIAKRFNTSNAVVFDSVSQQVTIVGKGSFKAAFIKDVRINENFNGDIKIIESVKRQVGNPTVHVAYVNPRAEFDVSFYNNHLDINWNVQYEEINELHGLIGQFMQKGIDVDIQKELILYSDGRDPVPVVKDTAMTGKQCWKAMNFGKQGEGLIKGKILDYYVSSILKSDFTLEN